VTLHDALLAKVEDPDTPDAALRLALWSVLQETGRVFFADRNGARYPLRAAVIERHLADALQVVTP
jgi:hypothetical protein